MNLFRRVINIPEKMETGIFVAILFLTVQAEILFFQLTGVEITGMLAGIAAVVAPLVTALLKIALERFVPVVAHPIVNAILIFIAGYMGARAIFAFTALL